MVRLSFGFLDLGKNKGDWLFTRKLKQFKLKCEMVTLKGWVTSLVKWGYEGVLGLFPRIRANDI